MTLAEKTFENIVRKTEYAGIRAFLFFPPYFLTFQRDIFHGFVICKILKLSILTSLTFCPVVYSSVGLFSRMLFLDLQKFFNPFPTRNFRLFQTEKVRDNNFKFVIKMVESSPKG